VSLPEKAAAGERKATLAALRDVLASSIVEADPDKRAPLAARLVEVLDKLAALEPPEQKKGTVVDELKARRAHRGSEAPRAGRASRQAE
jgi:hypothetical protein